MRAFITISGWLAALAAGALFIYSLNQTNTTPGQPGTQVVTLSPESYNLHKFEQDLLDKVEAVATPVSTDQVKISGWMPDWDYADAKTRVKALGSKLAVTHPFWYSLQQDGSLKVLNGANDQDLLTYAKNNNIKVIPTVTCFDHALLSTVLRDPANFDRHLNNIYNAVINNNYDGIDLDYETIRLADRDLFYEFIDKLSEKLHAQNKQLSLTVVSKWGDTVLYGAQPQTREVFDYSALHSFVDKFNIMTYDYLGRDPAKAGPMGPIAWQEKVIKYAIAKGVPREKIFLGVHTYAYDWSDRPILSASELANYDVVGGKFVEYKTENARAYYHDDVDIVKQRYGLTSQFNESWGEHLGSYMLNGKKRIVVFLGNEGITARKQLAAKYGIGGLAYWRLGDEGSLQL